MDRLAESMDEGLFEVVTAKILELTKLQVTK